MKHALLVALVVLVSGVPAVPAQTLAEISRPAGGNGRSQRSEVSQWIGPVKVSIEYHSPSVHTPSGEDRQGHIWGELVPYGFFDDGHGPSRSTPWRAGANETTTISFSHPVRVEGHELAAGTYGLFLLLAEDAPWTWIFSTDASGWGSYQYDPAHDVLRVAVTPQAAPPTEFLTYEFDDRRESSAVAELRWETKRVPLKIEVPNVSQVYVDLMRKELLGWPGFNYQNWQKAAQFCADKKINLAEALTWADKAIEEPFRGASFGKRDFSTLQTKAAVLRALGRKEEAGAIMDSALQIPDTPLVQVYFYAASLLAAGEKEKALEVFRLNQHRHPEEKFWTYLGLAQAYTALADKAHAIENWKVALGHVPDSERASAKRFAKALLDLEGGK